MSAAFTPSHQYSEVRVSFSKETGRGADAAWAAPVESALIRVRVNKRGMFIERGVDE